MKFNSKNLEMIAVPKMVLSSLLQADPDYLKVYLMGLLNPEMDQVRICNNLSISEGKFLSAIEYLNSKGYIEFANGGSEEIIYKAPDVSADYSYINTLYMDEDFNVVLQSLFGDRNLSRDDYGVFYRLADTYSMEKKLILLLAEYCIQVYGVNVSSKQIMHIASNWKDSGINDIDSAQQRINSYTKYFNEIRYIMSVFNIRRMPTEVEITVYEKWKEQWGFSFEAIKEALNVTTNASNPTFKYLDGILKNYYQKNLITYEDIHEYQVISEYLDDRIKEILRVLSYSKMTVNDNYRNLYRGLLDAGFTGDGILLVAKFIATKKNSSFEQLYETLIEWSQKNVVSTGQIEQYIENENRIAKNASAMLSSAGIIRVPTKNDMQSYVKFSTEYNFSNDVINYAASLSAGKSRPVNYMNSILEKWSKQGIRNLQDARNTTKDYSTYKKGRISDINEREYEKGKIEEDLNDPTLDF